MAKPPLSLLSQLRRRRTQLSLTLNPNRHSSTKKRKQLSLPFSYYRGGTSRALFFHLSSLPLNRQKWAHIFRSVIGSPDPYARQLDGLGGGVSSLSKICVCSATPDGDGEADIDFVFVAVGVRDGAVDYSASCGNVVAAVGCWGVDQGVVQLKDEEGEKGRGERECVVRIRNVNSGKIVRASFEVVDGEAAAGGEYVIDGVAGAGARIELGFLEPAGSKTGKLLPSGKRWDGFEVRGKRVRGTCVNVGNPCVFVQADELGIDGTVLPEQMDGDSALLGMLESIRTQAAVMMGLCALGEKPPESIPKIAMVSRPSTHRLLSGETLAAGNVDLVARAMSVGQPHRAVPITVAMALAAAADLEGSVVAELVKGRVEEGSLTIGHPSGRTAMGCEWTEDGETLVSCKVFRTARRLMEGRVFWKDEGE